ncbi:MAG TPA: hypothetical protein VMI56_12045 [Reyranella sp.]|nr:hypothetical protein [Reyranella sp.]
MPVHWTISHPTRLVVAVCKNAVCRTDMETYLDGVVVGGAMPYRKIFEFKNAAQWQLDDNDMMALGARIRAYARTGPMGPLAIVAGTDEAYETAMMFATLGEADRPLKIFRELHAARQWLDKQPSAGM